MSFTGGCDFHSAWICNRHQFTIKVIVGQFKRNAFNIPGDPLVHQRHVISAEEPDQIIKRKTCLYAAVAVRFLYAHFPDIIIQRPFQSGDVDNRKDLL